MDSSTPLVGFFDPTMLPHWSRYSMPAWPLLEAQDPFLASENEAELKLGLRRTIVALFAAGVTGGDQLQKLALAPPRHLRLDIEGGGRHGFDQSDI